MIPKVNYIVNGSGEKLFVQLSVEDWERLMSEHSRLVSTSKFRRNLQAALTESTEIANGTKKAVELKDFLNEL